MTKLHKLLRDAEEQFNNMEVAYESSMLSYSHNADLLTEKAYVDGIEAAVTTVGDCETCVFAMNSNKGKDYIDCKNGNGIHKKDWYCADFKRYGINVI